MALRNFHRVSCHFHPRSIYRARNFFKTRSICKSLNVGQTSRSLGINPNSPRRHTSHLARCFARRARNFSKSQGLHRGESSESHGLHRRGECGIFQSPGACFERRVENFFKSWGLYRAREGARELRMFLTPRAY